jgi:hypothetical protein
MSSRRVELGLLAAALSTNIGDIRESLLLLPLQYDAAQRIGIDPDEVFEKVGALIGGDQQSWLTAFCRRNEEDKSLDEFGYIPSVDEGGFRYQRMW